MTLYSVALFAHVAGAVLFFAALTLDGVALLGLRRAAALSQVTDCAGVARLTRLVGPASAVAILVPGLYMMASAWGWAAWIVAGAAGWLLAAVLGAVSGIQLAATVRDVAGQGPVPLVLAARLRHPLLASSWLARAAIGAGILFVMTVKPPPAAAAAAIAAPAAAVLAGGATAWRRSVARTGTGPADSPAAAALGAAGAGPGRAAAGPGTDGAAPAAEPTVGVSHGGARKSLTPNH